MTTPFIPKISTLIAEVDNQGNKNGKIDTKEEIALFSYKADDVISNIDYKLGLLEKDKYAYEDSSRQYRRKTANISGGVVGLSSAAYLGLKLATASLGLGFVGAAVGGAIGFAVGYFAGKGIGALTDSNDNKADAVQKQIQKLNQEKSELIEEYFKIKHEFNTNG